jgi:hypothetical protein
MAADPVNPILAGTDAAARGPQSRHSFYSSQGGDCKTSAFGLVPPSGLVISGPVIGDVQAAYSFTATVSPITATLPISYSWQATDQTAVTSTGGLSDTVEFVWSTPGSKTITVTAGNAAGLISTTSQITISESENRYFFPIAAKEIPILVTFSVDAHRYGEIFVTGFVENTSSQPVYSVTLTITLAIPPGSTTFSVTPAFAATLPGQKNPFLLDPHIWNATGAQVDLSTWTWESVKQYAPVTIVSKNTSCDGLNQVISGEIRNDQTYNLGDVRVAVFPWGTLANLEQDHLAPGETTSYIYSIFEEAGYCIPSPPEWWEVWGQGILES